MELHDKRHREIATLIQHIHRLDGCTSKVFNRKGKGRDKNKLKLDLDALELDVEEADEEEREINWDNNSSTLNEEDAEERKQAWNDAVVGRAAKAERKIAKNQVRFNVITKEDLDSIQNALHPTETKDHTNEAAPAPKGQGLIDNRYVCGLSAKSIRSFCAGPVSGTCVPIVRYKQAHAPTYLSCLILAVSGRCYLRVPTI